MSNKTIEIIYPKSNVFLYAIVRRESDKKYLDLTDGVFKSLPITNMYLTITEDLVVKSLYSGIESHIWSDDSYLISVYEKIGINPSLTDDFLCGINTMVIRGDSEKTEADKMDDIKRLLGLMHENIYIDLPTYDDDNNMIAARVRIYSNSNDVGTSTNVIGSYEISCDTTGPGKFNNWKQVKL